MLDWVGAGRDASAAPDGDEAENENRMNPREVLKMFAGGKSGGAA